MSYILVESCCATESQYRVEEQHKVQLLTCGKQLALGTDAFFAILGIILAVGILLVTNGLVDFGPLNAIAELGPNVAYIALGVAGGVMIINLAILFVKMSSHIHRLAKINHTLGESNDAKRHRKLEGDIVKLENEKGDLTLELAKAHQEAKRLNQPNQPEGKEALEEECLALKQQNAALRANNSKIQQLKWKQQGIVNLLFAQNSEQSIKKSHLEDAIEELENLIREKTKQLDGLEREAEELRAENDESKGAGRMPERPVQVEEDEKMEGTESYRYLKRLHHFIDASIPDSEGMSDLEVLQDELTIFKAVEHRVKSNLETIPMKIEQLLIPASTHDSLSSSGPHSPRDKSTQPEELEVQIVHSSDDDS